MSGRKKKYDFYGQENQDNLFDEMSIKMKMACGCLGASLVVMLILGVTLYINRITPKGEDKGPQNSVVETVISENEAEVSGSGGLTSADLDFWDMYKEDEEDEKENPDEKSEENLKDDRDDSVLDANTASSNRMISDNNAVSENKGNKIESDGKHFEISMEGEEPEWVDILDELPKNEYKAENFQLEDPVLKYYFNGKLSSKFGVDISKDQTNVDFRKVADQGVDFVMLQLGARGYSSGKIILDSSFSEKMKNAQEAGLGIGIYFYSQAVTKEEAVEEANYVIAAASGYAVTYPVVFYTEEVLGDSARTDNINNEKLTDCAIAFCEAVKKSGYIPMICADERQFAKRIDITKLTGYEWWLRDSDEKSDFPYKYSIRQYSQKGKVDGIEGEANLDICFLDFVNQ